MPKRQISEYIKLYPIFLLYFIFAQTAIAQELQNSFFPREKFALHPKFGVSFNNYTAAFTSIGDMVQCKEYTKGSGSGITFMFTGEIPLSRKTFLSLGIGYMDRSGSLLVSDTFPQRSNDGKSIVFSRVENTLKTNISFLEIQPDFRFIILPKLYNGPLRGFAGLRFYIPLGGTFEQDDKLVYPDYAVFNSNNRRDNHLASGNIKDMSGFGAGLSLGLENMLYLSKRLHLTQQFTFDYNFTDFVKEATWGMYAFRLDVGIRYSFRSPAPLPPAPVFPPDASLPEPPQPKEDVVKIDTIKIDTTPKPELSVKFEKMDLILHTGNELLASLPLVNAVFFDKGSAQIPDYYLTDSAYIPTFWESEPLGIHKYVLLRIADIVKNNDQADIVLEGATSGTKKESGGTSLAGRRAQAVRKVLLALGIPKEKIKTKAHSFPKFKSNQAFNLGVVENQRVDIIVKNAPLQEYVALQKFAELNGSIDIKADFKNIPDTGIVKLHNSFPETSRPIKNPETINIPVKNRIKPEDKTISFSTEIAYINYLAEDTKLLKKDSLPQKVIDLDLSKFEALIRFDYNSSELSTDNKGLLTQMAKFLPEGTIITIYGSADALGSDERNAELAKGRADNTEKFIRGVAGNKFTIETATDARKFNEESPEGRFLNRSIKVRVRKAK